MLAVPLAMLALAGCGGSGAGSGMRVDGARPAGYVTHAGAGFTIAAPPGWGGTPTKDPAGNLVLILTPPGGGPNAAIYTYVEPPPAHTIERELSDADQLRREVDAPRQLHQRIESVRVAGAARAKLVKASFLNAQGPARSLTLYVSTRDARLISVRAGVLDSAPRSLDVAGVIRSFRLSGT